MIDSIIQHLKSMGIDVVSSSDEFITTKHKISGRCIKVCGYLNSGFPHALPIFFLCERAGYGLLAHVGWPGEKDQGLICRGADDTLSLNYHCPEKLYYESLVKSLKPLEPVLADEGLNVKECLQEFVGHWGWAVAGKKEDRLLVVATPHTLVEDLTIRTPISGGKGLSARTVAITEDFQGLHERYCVRSSAHSANRRKRGKGCLIDLPSVIPPPGPGLQISTWWIDMLGALSQAETRALKEFARHRDSKECWIVARTVIEEQPAWFAIKGVSVAKRNFPLSTNYLEGWKLSAQYVDVHSKDSLLPRGGASGNLQGKTVTLVGCGSVGSIIAEQMASSGIGSLKLVDYDTFESGNLYRHTLDMTSYGRLKADALAAKLRFNYPYTKFAAVKSDLATLPDTCIRESDLFIIAIGNPTHELRFNERLVSEGIKIPAVYCWVEAYGVGGHAVFTSEDHSSGCLACNYYDPASGPTLHSTMNFLYPNQSVTKDLGSCGSLFLPYSQLDASQTATIAGRMALRYLVGDLNRSTRSSWRGNSKDAISMSLKLNHRYHRLKRPMEDQSYKQENCPVCENK